MMANDRVIRYRATFSNGIKEEDNRTVIFNIFFYPEDMQDSILYREGGAVKFQDATEEERDQEALRSARTWFDGKRRQATGLKLTSVTKQILSVQKEKELL